MQQRMEKLINFIEEYAEDFLGDGTKDRIIKKLKDGDTGLAIDIVKVMDKEWVDRAKEMKKFCLFTDSAVTDENGNKLKKSFYKANYIDILGEYLSKVPTLREVRPRDLGLFNINNDWNFEK